MQQRHTQYIQFALVAALLVGCIAVLLPFVGTLLFAIVICVTSWPLYARLLSVLRSRHNLAALIMSLSLVLYAPGTEVLGVRIWSLYQDGRWNELAALGVVTSVAVVVLGLAALALGRTALRGARALR